MHDGEGQRGDAQLAPSLVSEPHSWAHRPSWLFFSNSDDHLLKNIELFDKLSLRFNGRVLFLKDVIGDEICCWSFYGQGRKLAEVCCTSIVYATEKKQTKVWRASLCVGGTGHTAAQPQLCLSPQGAKKECGLLCLPQTHVRVPGSSSSSGSGWGALFWVS